MTVEEAKRHLAATVCAVCVSATLLGFGAAPGLAGEVSHQWALSGLIMPLKEAHVQIVSAQVDIRLPDAHGHVAAIRHEYEMRSDSQRSTHLRVALPVFGYIHGTRPSNPKLGPAIKFDGNTLAYSYLGYEDLSRPFLDKWAQKGWELLQAADPELKAQLHALDETDDQVARETREALDAHVHA
ncbi:MAG: hypothetical protein HQ582_11105, partial [Planctomycetes bacterium]|nr:hypothetical protein [Planctomycetota bacterium]